MIVDIRGQGDLYPDTLTANIEDLDSIRKPGFLGFWTISQELVESRTITVAILISF